MATYRSCNFFIYIISNTYKTMQDINNSKILPALIRGFFDGFYCGLTDYSNDKAAETMQPKKIKEVMTENYESVSVAFNDTLFYPISCLNYTYDEVTELLKGIDPTATDMLQLVKKACRTEECFETMKTEYCRNLLTMLEGHYPALQTYFETHAEDKTQAGDTMTGSDAAIGMGVRTVMAAYAEGLKTGGRPEAMLRQATVFRLVLDVVTTLLHDAPVDTTRIGSFEELVMAVCRTSHNIDVMTDEMNRMHEELITTETKQ